MQMNDAHIYCAEEQFEQEFMAVIGLYLEYFKLFGIEKYVMRFSTHHRKGLGKKYVDNERLWLKTEDMVRRAMSNGGVPLRRGGRRGGLLRPEDRRAGLERHRQGVHAGDQPGGLRAAGPLQPDLHGPRMAHEETPLCIHRAPLSTHERMIGFLIEHYAANFPVWLAPEQVRVIPITDAHNEYAASIAERLRRRGRARQSRMPARSA